MKTLDDALKTPGVIEPDTYEIDSEFVYLASTEPGVLVDGIVTAQTLRRIADHLDPPATEEPRGCPLPGACACSTATLHIDRIKAEARREALKEAEQKVKQEAHYPICENGKPDLLHCGLHNCPCWVRKELAKDIEAAIRALIEKEPEA